jgi:hypothetical protein
VLIREYKNHYNIAYTYFKLKEYDQRTYFQNQIETVKDDKVRLTTLPEIREIVICNTKYWPAMDNIINRYEG